MEQSKVAGTVILNQENGHKKFLVKKENKDVAFINVSGNSNVTSLACILDELNDVVGLDSSHMDLVELTNINIHEEKVPFYVFSMDETKLLHDMEDNVFLWETPSILREVLQKFNVSGVPYFY
ncbi:hypothetical protein [Vagococcus jeotgali]|uniref:hypothetical protein n=1 Tax=Vagococcus jeotgali TaxID=3109030 RepID=UPI002DD9ADC0|nr:hypothetical protein [Vagococcus sp. B2T-5]